MYYTKFDYTPSPKVFTQWNTGKRSLNENHGLRCLLGVNSKNFARCLHFEYTNYFCVGMFALIYSNK